MGQIMTFFVPFLLLTMAAEALGVPPVTRSLSRITDPYEDEVGIQVGAGVEYDLDKDSNEEIGILIEFEYQGIDLIGLGKDGYYILGISGRIVESLDGGPPSVELHFAPLALRGPLFAGLGTHIEFLPTDYVNNTDFNMPDGLRIRAIGVALGYEDYLQVAIDALGLRVRTGEPLAVYLGQLSIEGGPKWEWQVGAEGQSLAFQPSVGLSGAYSAGDQADGDIWIKLKTTLQLKKRVEISVFGQLGSRYYGMTNDGYVRTGIEAEF